MFHNILIVKRILYNSKYFTKIIKKIHAKVFAAKAFDEICTPH